MSKVIEVKKINTLCITFLGPCCILMGKHLDIITSMCKVAEITILCLTAFFM